MNINAFLFDSYLNLSDSVFTVPGLQAWDEITKGDSGPLQSLSDETSANKNKWEETILVYSIKESVRAKT